MMAVLYYVFLCCLQEALEFMSLFFTLMNICRLIGVFQIFYPETTDVYDRKNMPRVMYCIHALR